MPSLLTSLLLIFVPLSFVTIGGGQTIVADVHRQVVDVHHWMTASQFLDLFAISRMAPGPGSLLVTLIGWQVSGLAGAIVATFAIFTPTAIMTFCIARIWQRTRGARWQVIVEAGLRPIAVGTILASVYVLLQALDGGWLAKAIALASTAILLATPVNPLLLLFGGGLTFVAVQTLMPMV
ncbi:chromate transporter [Afipia sp. P52-10]|jgi:chromate transporter|uniref:chromate transporter n=1 Tax=Afipia sp. P52-10 TaxID=1429916 RepID=UPI0003DF26D6|nr:chromate transporter [Afipia sp. P52-10]ETR78751.1 chromate transporter [Afipia sp. P52-10]